MTGLYDCIECGVQPKLEEYIHYDERGENGAPCAYYICPKCMWSTALRCTKEIAMKQWQSNNKPPKGIFGRIVYDGRAPSPAYIEIKSKEEEE